MPPAANETRPLRIKKYSNRRFYDVTRSRHVGLGDLYELVAQGRDLTIEDSKTGRDITNVVLMQLILEREADKLAIFPPAILHQVIRTQRQYLGTVVEQFFRQALQAQRAVQEQWARFFQNTLGAAAQPVSPADWSRAFFGPFVPGAADSTSPATPGAPPRPERDRLVEDLRRQVAELSKRLERLAAAPARASRRRKPGR